MGACNKENIVTQIGSFWEGVIIIVLGVAIAAVGKYIGVDYGSTSALIVGIGIGHLKSDSTNGDTPPPKTP